MSQYSITHSLWGCTVHNLAWEETRCMGWVKTVPHFNSSSSSSSFLFLFFIYLFIFSVKCNLIEEMLVVPQLNQWECRRDTV